MFLCMRVYVVGVTSVALTGVMLLEEGRRSDSDRIQMRQGSGSDWGAFLIIFTVRISCRLSAHGENNKMVKSTVAI